MHTPATVPMYAITVYTATAWCSGTRGIAGPGGEDVGFVAPDHAAPGRAEEFSALKQVQGHGDGVAAVAGVAVAQDFVGRVAGWLTRTGAGDAAPPTCCR